MLHHTPLQLFPDDQERERIKKTIFHNSDAFGERGSQFIAMATKVANLQEIRRAYIGVSKIYPLADHIAVGYKVPHSSGFQDDDEHAVGWTIAKVINEANASNVAVFLVRPYGGDKLGKKCFELIQNAAKQAFHRMP